MVVHNYKSNCLENRKWTEIIICHSTVLVPAGTTPSNFTLRFIHQINLFFQCSATIRFSVSSSSIHSSDSLKTLTRNHIFIYPSHSESQSISLTVFILCHSVLFFYHLFHPLCLTHPQFLRIYYQFIFITSSLYLPLVLLSLFSFLPHSFIHGCICMCVMFPPPRLLMLSFSPSYPPSLTLSLLFLYLPPATPVNLLDTIFYLFISLSVIRNLFPTHFQISFFLFRTCIFISL